MAKEKAPGHVVIPYEFFQQLWPTLGFDFHWMILKSTELVAFNKGVTRGLLSLIPKEGDNKDLKSLATKDLR